jgi:hypothetical protein
MVRGRSAAGGEGGVGPACAPLPDGSKPFSLRFPAILSPVSYYLINDPIYEIILKV